MIRAEQRSSAIVAPCGSFTGSDEFQMVSVPEIVLYADLG
jgi:hypothetical protein